MTIPRLRGEGFLESQLRQLSYFCLISGKLKLNSPTPTRSKCLSNMLISERNLRNENSGFLCALGMSELYRVKVPKCGRWRQAHSQRQGLNREVPTEGSPRQTIDLTNRNGLRHMLSGKTA